MTSHPDCHSQALEAPNVRVSMERLVMLEFPSMKNGVVHLNKRMSLDIFNIDPHIGVHCVALVSRVPEK